MKVTFVIDFADDTQEVWEVEYPAGQFYQLKEGSLQYFRIKGVEYLLKIDAIAVTNEFEEFTDRSGGRAYGSQHLSINLTQKL